MGRPRWCRCPFINDASRRLNSFVHTRGSKGCWGHGWGALGGPGTTGWDWGWRDSPVDCNVALTACATTPALGTGCPEVVSTDNDQKAPRIDSQRSGAGAWQNTVHTAYGGCGRDTVPHKNRQMSRKSWIINRKSRIVSQKFVIRNFGHQPHFLWGHCHSTRTQRRLSPSEVSRWIFGRSRWKKGAKRGSNRRADAASHVAQTGIVRTTAMYIMPQFMVQKPPGCGYSAGRCDALRTRPDTVTPPHLWWTSRPTRDCAVTQMEIDTCLR